MLFIQNNSVSKYEKQEKEKENIWEKSPVFSY